MVGVEVKEKVSPLKSRNEFKRQLRPRTLSNLEDRHELDAWLGGAGDAEASKKIQVQVRPAVV